MFNTKKNIPSSKNEKINKKIIRYLNKIKFKK